MRTARALLLPTIVAGLALQTSALAQSLPRPEGWRVRVDGSVQDTVSYVRMPPGWHVTTGPGAILYDPAFGASGRFAIESEFHLFPGTSQSGYGIFVGGSDLDGRAPRYLALVIRRDGQIALETVEGSRRTLLVPWTASAAVRPHPGGDETVRNVIRLSVERDSILVDANGTRVLAVPKGELSVDGAFGLRAGSDVNLHVTSLDHLQRHAPTPARRGRP